MKRLQPATLIAALAALATLAPCRRSDASPLFELAGAQTGTGGYNARATGASAASTYYNPALLGRARESFDVGLLVLSEEISLTLDGRTGGNVPDSVGGRAFIDGQGRPLPNDTVPTRWLEEGCTTCDQPPFRARPRQARGSSAETYDYAVVGLVNQLIDQYLVLGFYALVPLGDFTTANAFYNDEREQLFSNSLHPEFYSDRMTATSLSFGLGSQIVDELAVGLSFTLNLTNRAQASTYVRDPIDYDTLLLSTDVSVKASVSPHLGVAYDPLEWLHLSATAHSKQQLAIDMGVAAALPAGQESDTERRFVHSILPWTFGAGAQIDIVRDAPHTFGVVGNVRYALWSDYRDRHGERPDADDPDLGFDDVFAGTLGVRHAHGPLSTYLDVNYQPTPVPKQVGRRNYVDNDRLSAIIGAGYDFELVKVPLRFGVQAQAQRLLHRYQAKDNSRIRDELPDDAQTSDGRPVLEAAGLQTNNPGWPGFASEGWILGGALTLSLLY